MTFKSEDEIRKITDIEEALEIVASNGYNYYYLSNTLKDNREVAMTAVRQEVESMASCPNKFKSDKSFVMEAINFQPMLVEYISPKLQDNLHVMLFAVNENGYALQYASERLKNNPKIVLVALESAPDVIEHASQRLQDVAGLSPQQNLKQFIKTGVLHKKLQKSLNKSESEQSKKIKI